MSNFFNYDLAGTAASVPTTGRYKSVLVNAEFPQEAKSKVTGTVDQYNFLNDIADVITTYFNDENKWSEILWKTKDTGILILTTFSSQNNITLTLLDDFNDGGERVRKLLEEVKNKVRPLPELSSTVSRVKFWYMGGDGPENRTREIDVPTWAGIKENYADSCKDQLDDLMSLKPEQIGSGKILLLHGPPGTGKTTSIRALINAWSTWCNTEYVVDPEVAFGNGSYLVQLLLNDGNYYEEFEDGEWRPKKDKWRLIIIEDAEEFLKPDAKEAVGQSVSRLLNFGDGLIGQGLKVLVLMTTNVPVKELHEAIIRLGRCLVNIEVPKLNKAEATKWLGKTHEEASLAQLYELKTSSQINSNKKSEVFHGQYL